MHLVTTGGAGFIGSHLARHALAVDDAVRVTTLDALTYAGHRSTIADLEATGRHRLVVGDVRDAALVAELVADADAVVHLAAESHVDRSIDGPAVFLETNVVGAGVVFEACRRAEVPRVLHVSTDEVYGPVAAPHHATEDDPLTGSSPYAASKAAADLLAAAYRTTYGYPITVTRTTNNYGPFHLPEKMIPRAITRLLAGGTVPVYGDGLQVRDWTYVADNAAAQWTVLTEGEPGGVYNVGAGQEVTNRALAEALVERFGRGEDAIEHVADRPGHDRRYAVDAGRVRELGWRPEVTLDEGLERTIAWFRDREDWWRPLVEAGAATRRGGASEPVSR